MSLDANTVLVRAPGLSLELDSSNFVNARLGGRKVECGPRGLAVLDAFARPTRFADAMEKLSVMGAADWAGAVATAKALEAAGMLVRDVASVTPALGASQTYDGASIHVRMLDDRARTQTYLDAIAATVREGDVVVEIGTGSGVLAVAAARAGARRVYAIEASSIADTAKQVFVDNGVDDRVTLVRGWSTEVTLPEKADVLISEIIGDHALGEQVRQIHRDAVARFLKPDARVVPGALAMDAHLLECDDKVRAEHMVDERHVARWQAGYGTDFGALARASSAGDVLHFVRPQATAGWTACAPPARVAEFDLAAVPGDLDLDTRTGIVATTTGDVDCVLLSFDLTLAPGIVHSTSPNSASDENHWFAPLWILAQPVHVEAGERLEVIYTLRGGDESCAIVKA